VALPFQFLGIHYASYAFSATNCLLLGACFYALVEHFRLDWNERLLLLGVFTMFYPVMFLLERGNLDGLMLSLMLLAIFSRNSIVRGLGLGLSVSLKAYSILLLGPFLLGRLRKAVALCLLVVLGLLLSFHSLLLPFLQAQRARSLDSSILENISPAALLPGGVKYSWLRLVFTVLWAGSFVFLLHYTRRASVTSRSISSLPWMMAMPLHVFPYTGVLCLPLLVLRHAVVVRRGKVSRGDTLFVAGFLLLGTQQRAATEYLIWLTHSHQLFGTFNALGTVLVMLSTLIHAKDTAADPDSDYRGSDTVRRQLSQIRST